MNKNYTNNMKVLNIISVSGRTIFGERFSPLSQTEIADKAGLKLHNVNKIMKNLIADGLVEKVPQKCRKYKITESCREALKRVKK